MKRSLLFLVFVLSSSIAFSQGLAFSQILMVPQDVQGTTTTISGDSYLEVQVPQGKVWKITSVPRNGCGSNVVVKTNINPNGLFLTTKNLDDYYYETESTLSDTRPNLISPQSTIWLGENHSLSFYLNPAGTGVSCPMLNVIEYDVVP